MSNKASKEASNEATGAGSKSPRLSVRLPARISTIDPEADPYTGKSFFRFSEESSANLSRGGVFVSMRETIPPGRRVLVEIEMPGGRTVQAVGRVAWTRVSKAPATGSPAGSSTATESGVGVEFVAGPAGDLQALEQFVSRTLRLRSTPGSETQTATQRR